MCELPEKIEVSVESIFQLPSNQIYFDTLMTLKTERSELVQADSISGITVIYGTDKLEETVYFFDLTVLSDHPVVITGSMSEPEEIGSDAVVNVCKVFIVVVCAKMKHTWVTVVFNEHIFTARYVTKVHSYNVQGFSVGYI